MCSFLLLSSVLCILKEGSSSANVILQQKISDAKLTVAVYLACYVTASQITAVHGFPLPLEGRCG